MPPRTSNTHPLRIDTINLMDVPAMVGIPGSMGLTFCPGKVHKGIYGKWDRDLESDIDVIQKWGANIWVNTMEFADMVSVGIDPEEFEISIRRKIPNICYIHFPIVDGSIPDFASSIYWQNCLSPELQNHLRDGKKILIHCRGGLGRTGTIAARLLVDLCIGCDGIDGTCGISAEDAISIVRKCRNGAIENSIQENWISSGSGIDEEGYGN